VFEDVALVDDATAPGGADLVLRLEVKELSAYKQASPGRPSADGADKANARGLATVFGLAGFSLNDSGALGRSGADSGWAVAKVIIRGRLSGSRAEADLWQGEGRGAVMQRFPWSPPAGVTVPTVFDLADTALKRAVDRIATEVHTRAIGYQATN
jgi:hypothetical protein